VEVHHITIRCEAPYRYGDPHALPNLIGLCPGCHARADNGEISREELHEAKQQLSAAFVEGADGRALEGVPSLEAEAFQLHLDDWHRLFTYKGRGGQLRDYLERWKTHLRGTDGLQTSRGVGVLASLGGLLRRQGSRHFPQARKCLDTALLASNELKKTDWLAPVVGRILYDRGYMGFLTNDYGAALEDLEHSIAVYAKLRHEVGLRITASIRELVHARTTGQFGRATLSENLKVFAASDAPDARRWVANCHVHLATFCLEQRDPEAAHVHLDEAEREFDRSRIVTGSGKVLYIRGACHLLRGERERALHALAAAVASYRRFGRCEELAGVCHAYGRALEHAGDHGRAGLVYKMGFAADPLMDNRAGIAKCKRRLRVLRLA